MCATSWDVSVSLTNFQNYLERIKSELITHYSASPETLAEILADDSAYNIQDDDALTCKTIVLPNVYFCRFKKTTRRIRKHQSNNNSANQINNYQSVEAFLNSILISVIRHLQTQYTNLYPDFKPQVNPQQVNRAFLKVLLEAIKNKHFACRLSWDNNHIDLFKINSPKKTVTTQANKLTYSNAAANILIHKHFNSSKPRNAGFFKPALNNPTGNKAYQSYSDIITKIGLPSYKIRRKPAKPSIPVNEIKPVAPKKELPGEIADAINRLDQGIFGQQKSKYADYINYLFQQINQKPELTPSSKQQEQIDVELKYPAFTNYMLEEKRRAQNTSTTDMKEKFSADNLCYPDFSLYQSNKTHQSATSNETEIKNNSDYADFIEHRYH